MMHRSTGGGLALAMAFGMGLSLSEASAETFNLKSGDRLEGQVVRSIGNTLSIKLQGRGMRQLPINAVDQIELQLSSGEAVVGELIAWSAGAFEIRVDDRLLSIMDGVILQTLAIEENEAGEEVEEPAADVAAAKPAIELAPAALDQREDGDGVGGPRIALKELADGETAIAAARAGADVAAGADEVNPALAELPSLTGATMPTKESAGEIAIQFSLSKPVDRPIAVLYSAVDGSAVSGVDFQAQAGVLTIQAGVTTVDVKIPLIDDDEPEDAEQFRLFLSVDPNAVSMANRHVTATISDDD